jgi:hypothetical protein
MRHLHAEEEEKIFLSTGNKRRLALFAYLHRAPMYGRPNGSCAAN